MCFSLQRRANFARQNFKKWSKTLSFLTFWVANVLLATAACSFPHPNFKKWSETVSFLTFWLANVLLARAACKIWASELQKVVRSWCVLCILTWRCASRHSGVQLFISPLNRYLRTRRFIEPTFRPSRPTNHWKNTAIRDLPNISILWIIVDLLSTSFRAIVSSFFWLYFSSLLFIFWLYYTLLLFSAFSTVHAVGS